MLDLLVQISRQNADLVVRLALGENSRYVASAGAGNRLAPLVSGSEAAPMQVFDRDDDIGTGAEQNDSQRMATLALGLVGLRRNRLWRCVGRSTENEICHWFLLCF